MKHIKKYKLQMYIDGELNNSEQKRVKSHLSICSKCKITEKEILDQISQIKKYMNDSEADDIQIPNLVFSAKREERIKHSGIRVPIPALAAMILLIVFMGVGLFLQNISLKEKSVETNVFPILNYVKLQNLNKEKIESMELDLFGYELPDKPKVKIIRRISNEKVL